MFCHRHSGPHFGVVEYAIELHPACIWIDLDRDRCGRQAAFLNKGDSMNHSDRLILYEIRVEGHIRDGWFEDLMVTPHPEGETVISGLLDQSALHGIFSRIRDLGLVLVSVQRFANEKGITHE